jgi:hypothetical protein
VDRTGIPAALSSTDLRIRGPGDPTGGLTVGAARLRAQSPPANNPGQPFAAILAKLDQLIAGVPPDVTSKLHSILGFLKYFDGGNTVGAWDRTYPTATRFVLLSEFNNEAFLDRETCGIGTARLTIPEHFPPQTGPTRCASVTRKRSGRDRAGGHPRSKSCQA